jgi:hypothetical protein
MTGLTTDARPNHTFEVCIDESGDDGMNCESGEWLILSALVSLHHRYPHDIQLVKDIKTELKWKLKKPLHFRDLKTDGKRLVIQRIAENNSRFRAISVLVHKPMLNSGDYTWHQAKHRLYFYSVRYLLERLSWLCRDSQSCRNRSIGDGTARIIFSAREDISYEDLAAYFERLQALDTQIAWNIIKPTQFKVLKNGRHPGLQLADAVASGMYCCDHHCSHKRTAEWAKLLKPAIYSRNGKYLGYGIKIFPPAANKQMAQKTLVLWATEHFK